MGKYTVLSGNENLHLVFNGIMTLNPTHFVPFHRDNKSNKNDKRWYAGGRYEEGTSFCKERCYPVASQPITYVLNTNHAQPLWRISKYTRAT
jgi:hypothetical protein